jgi:hypothetical protein
MATPAKKTIVLLDGHGRLVYHILAALKARGLNVDDYQLVLYEIDNDCHFWHKAFMPTGVTLEFSDIIYRSSKDGKGGKGTAKDAKDAKVRRFIDKSTAALYLNLCSLGRIDVDDILIQIRDSVKSGIYVMLGFSNRGIGSELQFTDKARFVKKVKHLSSSHFIRGSFETISMKRFVQPTLPPIDDDDFDDFDDF